MWRWRDFASSGWGRAMISMLCRAMLAGVILVGGAIARGEGGSTATEGMAWIPAGEFTMGSAPGQGHLNEQPTHRVGVDGFWMDVHEVTNQHFEEFVRATGHVTTAERAPDWNVMRTQMPEGTPKPPDELLVPGSLVFVIPSARDAGPGDWWQWVPGANWRCAEGPGSTIGGRMDHPVVHVSQEDAEAYAKWAGKSLPTEAQWERAARGGLDAKLYTWGDDPQTTANPQCNIWTGEFPVFNDLSDGHARTAPVGSFPVNGFGLHDMAGNVWEWCLDEYVEGAYLSRVDRRTTVNPLTTAGVQRPDQGVADMRVIRGGSFLCHDSYCTNYRPAGRTGVTADTSTAHLGFRCVKPGSRRPAEGAD